jgi:hypothetical protein
MAQTGTSSIVSAGLIAMALAISSCPATNDPPKAGLRVGDPCTEADGWHPAPISCDSRDAGNPTTCSVPAGYVDRPQLPPGIGFCLSPGGEYPYGYFTMNCSQNANCPAGSRCDGVLCRRPCTADSDCQSDGVKPFACSDATVGTQACAPPVQCAPGNGFRFCRCLACVPNYSNQ